MQTAFTSIFTHRRLPERCWLQLAVALAACVPVAAGLQGVIRGAMRLVPGSSVTLDSHYRYLSGLLLGLGLLFWSAIPQIERRGPLVRALTLMVTVGGVARAISLYDAGLPSPVMRFALLMELVVTPALCLWQMRVARRVDGAGAGR